MLLFFYKIKISMSLSRVCRRSLVALCLTVVCTCKRTPDTEAAAVELMETLTSTAPSHCPDNFLKATRSILASLARADTAQAGGCLRQALQRSSRSIPLWTMLTTVTGDGAGAAHATALGGGKSVVLGSKWELLGPYPGGCAAAAAVPRTASCHCASLDACGFVGGCGGLS